MHCHSDAVQILLANPAQEAGFMEAVALALDLLSKANCLLAHPTLLGIRAAAGRHMRDSTPGSSCGPLSNVSIIFLLFT